MTLAIQALHLEDAPNGAAAGMEQDVSDDKGEVAGQGIARAKPVRGPLPAHLPRERIVIPGPTACPCCNGKLAKLGGTVIETLEVAPRLWKVVLSASGDCGGERAATKDSLTVIAKLNGVTHAPGWPTCCTGSPTSPPSASRTFLPGTG